MGLHVEEITLKPMNAVAVRAVVPAHELPGFFSRAFHELEEVVRKSGAKRAGAPFARYHSVPPSPVEVEAIIPVNRPVAADGEVQAIILPAGTALQVRHIGPYEAIGPAYATLCMWMTEHGMRPSDFAWEVYLTSPQSVPDPKKWETLVIQPVQPGGR